MYSHLDDEEFSSTPEVDQKVWDGGWGVGWGRGANATLNFGRFCSSLPFP